MYSHNAQVVGGSWRDESGTRAAQDQYIITVKVVEQSLDGFSASLERGSVMKKLVRTDVPSSESRVVFCFADEPLSFVMQVIKLLPNKCTTCVECEDLCDVLEEILLTTTAQYRITPQRLGLIQFDSMDSFKGISENPFDSKTRSSGFASKEIEQ
ncbi:hypothetical protein TNIN_286401 [Trichonephila inaurata madagascariensis]|uniref:Uncharacterized protein n=1 Tax=Trichonephila inaurata madagascariensis TaxID=2747483 RepID=A0A8X6XLR3_9ARAC|nr:hypothetical protein TNIN_286401 [Trichonephila inaurata madagascariensis]